jgi:ketosteroid isomerase-like protein
MPTPHETLDRFFPAMFADDRDVLMELLTEDVEWRAPPFAVDSFGPLNDREAVVSFLTEGGDAFYKPGSFSMQTLVKAVEGDSAIVMGDIRATTAHDHPYSNRYAFGFRFRDGKICEAWELLDSASFQKQLKAR